MNLRQQYEKETGKKADSPVCHVEGITPAYFKWLESRSSWVSVKEKPPEDALSVLIFYDGHMSIGSYIKGQWFGIGSTFPIDVTHWMKPEPPVSP